MVERNRTRYAVLGALSLGPSSGYEVQRGLECTVGHFWRESFGQIYPILGDLVDRGWAAITRDDPGPRPKRTHTITDAGLTELRRWLQEPVAVVARPRNEVLLKLFFGSAISVDASLAHIARHREHVAAVRATYVEIERVLHDERSDDPGLPYWLATVRYGQLQADAALRWCDETTDRLEAAEREGVVREADTHAELDADTGPAAAT